jgi:hypothetical protein
MSQRTRTPVRATAVVTAVILCLAFFISPGHLAEAMSGTRLAVLFTMKRALLVSAMIAGT